MEVSPHWLGRKIQYMHLGGKRELNLVPLVNLDCVLIEERTLGTAAAVHYFGLLSVGIPWHWYSPRCCDRSGIIADPKDSYSGAVPGGGARLPLKEVPDGLGPFSEAEPECDAENKQSRDDEHAGEVATSEKGRMGSTGRW